MRSRHYSGANMRKANRKCSDQTPFLGYHHHPSPPSNLRAATYRSASSARPDAHISDSRYGRCAKTWRNNHCSQATGSGHRQRGSDSRWSSGSKSCRLRSTRCIRPSSSQSRRWHIPCTSSLVLHHSCCKRQCGAYLLSSRTHVRFSNAVYKNGNCSGRISWNRRPLGMSASSSSLAAGRCFRLGYGSYPSLHSHHIDSACRGFMQTCSWNSGGNTRSSRSISAHFARSSSSQSSCWSLPSSSTWVDRGWSHRASSLRGMRRRSTSS